MRGDLCELVRSKECGFSYGSNPVKLASFLENLAKHDKDLERLVKNAEKVFSSDLDGKKIYHSMIRYLEEIAADGSIDKNR